MARFQFFPHDRLTDRLTDKTDCLTPLHACARGVIMAALADRYIKRSSGPFPKVGRHPMVTTLALRTFKTLVASINWAAR